MAFCPMMSSAEKKVECGGKDCNLYIPKEKNWKMRPDDTSGIWGCAFLMNFYKTAAVYEMTAAIKQKTDRLVFTTITTGNYEEKPGHLLVANRGIAN
jgi:hypothetical protein